MARIVLTVGGYFLGNMLVGVDQQLFGGTAEQTVYGARMQDLRVQSSSYSSVIPTLYGRGRLAANVIWMRGFDEGIRTETQTVGSGSGGGKGGGKGGGGGGGAQNTTTVGYHYYADLAVGLCAGPISAVRRAFAGSCAITIKRRRETVGDDFFCHIGFSCPRRSILFDAPKRRHSYADLIFRNAQVGRMMAQSPQRAL